MGPRDIYLRPELGGLSSLDFAHVRAAIDAGESAARSNAAGLSAYAVSTEKYATYLARVAVRPAAPEIEFVHVAPEAGRYHKLIEAALEPTLGKPADAVITAADIAKEKARGGVFAKRAQFAENARRWRHAGKSKP